MRADDLSSTILRCGNQGVPVQNSNKQPNALRLLKIIQIEYIHSHLDGISGLKIERLSCKLVSMLYSKLSA